MIDIGGPTMVRAAAKNHAHVGIVVDPDDYDLVLAELREHGVLAPTTRRRLARAAFAHTAAYDAVIVVVARREDEPAAAADACTLHLALERAQESCATARTRTRLGPATAVVDSTAVVGRRRRSTAGKALSLPQPLRHRRGLAPRPRPG